MLNDLLSLLRYSVIRLLKMEFLLRVIEKFFENVKYLNNLIEFLKKFFRLWKSLMNSRRDLPPWPWQPGGGVKCGHYNARLRRYKALKNEISITGNRNILP